MNDANASPLELTECVWLKVRFANTLYMVTFIITARMVVDLIIGMMFLNAHIEVILCTEQRICSNNGSLPIVEKKHEKSVAGDSPFKARHWKDKEVGKSQGDNIKEKRKGGGNS